MNTKQSSEVAGCMHACTVLWEVPKGKLCVYQLLYITEQVVVVKGACGSAE